MTGSARTEEIRARVKRYPPGSNCGYCYGSEHYAEDVPYLLTELTALREEVDRLRGTLRRVAICRQSPPEGEVTTDEPWVCEVCGVSADEPELLEHLQDCPLAALSPSPAQQEEHNES